MVRSSRISVALVLGLAGCGGGGDAEPEAEQTAQVAPAASASVRILEPAEGSTVGPDVTVRVEVEGMDVAPVAEGVEGTGHHHFYLDADVSSWTEIIPTDIPGVVHRGDGSSEHTFTGVEPGEHRVIVVVGDLLHVPLDPPVADTVNFTVAG